MPGKPHISLTVAWALDHDPVEAVRRASTKDPIPEEDDINLHVGNLVSPPTIIR